MYKPPLTEEQRQEIINSDLSNIELAKLYDRNANTISVIRCQAGKGVGDLGKGKRVLTDEQISIMLNPNLSVKEASEQAKCSKKYIYILREKHNVITVKPIVEKKKRIYKPRPKVIKPKSPPKLSIKVAINKTRQKSESTSLTNKIEREQKELEKSLKLAENFRLTEAQQIASGLKKWVTRINKYGKNERALIKL